LYILVDEDRAVSKAYGVWHRIGLDAWNTAHPALFLIDRAGMTRAIWVSDRQDEFPGAEEIEEEVGRLAASG
jgi:peroxiredoxin